MTRRLREDERELPMEPMTVELNGVHLAIDGRSVVSNASLRAGPGDIVGILGPNGSGKSTLLRSLYRALRPESGDVVVGGADVWKELSARAAARRTAALTQHGLVDPAITVMDVVCLGRISHARNGFGRSSHDRRCAHDALVKVGLEHAADRALAQLSGGEQQRVHVARALCQGARVLVLDEPTNHLDVAHQFDLLNLVAASGLTVVMVLHDLNLAARYCTQVHLLRDGHVVASGDVAQVLTPEWIAEVFGVQATTVTDPLSNRPALLLSPFDKGER